MAIANARREFEAIRIRYMTATGKRIATLDDLIFELLPPKGTYIKLEDLIRRIEGIVGFDLGSDFTSSLRSRLKRLYELGQIDKGDTGYWGRA